MFLIMKTFSKMVNSSSVNVRLIKFSKAIKYDFNIAYDTYNDNPITKITVQLKIFYKYINNTFRI